MFKFLCFTLAGHEESDWTNELGGKLDVLLAFECPVTGLVSSAKESLISIFINITGLLRCFG
jgi:hypothetical protein